jgi:hypothetical protein
LKHIQYQNKTFIKPLIYNVRCVVLMGLEMNLETIEAGTVTGYFSNLQRALMASLPTGRRGSTRVNYGTIGGGLRNTSVGVLIHSGIFKFYF